MRKFCLFLVLLSLAWLCVPAYATKIGAANDSTAIAAVQVDVDLIKILSSDVLATQKIGGDVFYVNSNASGSATGFDWTNAELTIEAAIADCTADAGDWIIVHPAHAETASTGTFDADKAGVTIWGLGNGTDMPTISYDTSTDTCLIGADGDGVLVHGIKFIATVTAVAKAIVVEAGCTDFVIENCIFENETSTTDEFIDTIYITGTASDRGIIRNNRFLGDVGANAGPKSSINFIDCDYLQIIGNEFSGDIGDAHIFNETTASNYVTIKDNRIMCGFIGADSTNLDTTPGISLVATTTGWILNNFIVTNVATPDLAIVAADCYVDRSNTYTETQGPFSGSVSIGGAGANDGASGLRCAEVTIASVATVTNLFQVTGGPIIIRDIVGVVTTDIVATGCLINYNIDPIEPATDTVFGTDGTALEINGDAAGTVYTWDGVVATDLTETTTGVLLTQGTDVSNGILCPQGMIELAATATNAGVIKFYIVYSPLSPLSKVTPQ